ncbi:siderophore-interacting protein [Dyadobacter subterraneus]|uniref:Siderophore-interacting protein n=1 Tax=Dyadobacter subterraneus TaxID=2773304 RepID=A0ABR9WBD9_9BACT|nr:siderophore-interacting protein [Dyadobacter subterraneus]MBE9462745.1 siderophore-interacting protein [Dyadobacter subterraneus]
MANGLKKAVFSLLDKAFTQEGFVQAIRKWQPETMYEIDLHLPDVDMAKWTTIPRLKCKVAEYEYRDYTPATWDVKKRTCTMLIETDHNGFGSAWTKNLSVGDIILFSPAHAAQLPSQSGKIICFGDGSALGHFLALKQLTNRKEYPFEAVVFLNENYWLPDFFIYENPEFTFVMKPGTDSLDSLHQYSGNKTLSDYSAIYIAGYIPMVTGLRKIFKKNPYLTAKIFAHGFWS